MSHNFERVDWYIEGLLTLISGTTYGITSILVGHPLDTVKTKMQAQNSFVHDNGVIYAIKHLYKSEGLIGFYRGCIPPLIGSTIFRGLQFSIYDSIYSYCEKKNKLKQEIPFTGIQLRILLGGFCSASV